MEKQLNLGPPELRLYQLLKKLDDKIVHHISSALRDLGVIFDKSILSISTILVGADYSATVGSCYGTKNEEKNTHNNVVERNIRREMTVDTEKN